MALRILTWNLFHGRDFPPNPALFSNRCHSFVARDVVRVGDPDLDDGEDIEVVTVPLADIPGLVSRGDISHALVVVALTFAFGLGEVRVR